MTDARENAPQLDTPTPTASAERAPAGGSAHHAPLHITAVARPDDAAQLHRSFRHWAVSAGLADDLVTNLGFAVGEALANAAEHAYSARPVPGPMHLHADLTDDAVHVSVSDQGSWLPPATRPDSRGCGIALMRHTTHQLCIEQHPMTGTTVHLRAHR